MTTKQEFAERHNVGLADIMQDGILAILVRVFAVLTKNVGTAKAGKATATVGVKKAIATVSEESETVDAAETLRMAVSELLFTAIDGNRNLSVLLPDILSDIESQVRTVRDLVMAGLDIDDDEDDDVDTETAIQEAAMAKDILRDYETFLAMEGKSLKDLPPDMRKQKEDGTWQLKLPNVPSGKAEGGAGRPVHGSKFKFTLNGEPVNVSGFDRLAVFHCSTHTERMNGSELKELIRRQTGAEWSDKANATFTVNVPTGNLTGTLEASK